MEEYSAFVGLDAHKDTVAVAIAEAGRLGEVRFWGTVANEEVRIASLVKKLSRLHGRILVAYEAGACGYSIHRQISGLGHDCVVVAPSRVPKKSADRIKNDRRDALTLARLLRADELSPIWVPDTAHEAMRDLIRARHAAARDLQKTRQTIQSFMLRQDRRFDGRPWTKGHLRWLRRQSFEQPAQFIALESYLDSADRAVMRRDHLETEIKSQLRNWSLREQVSALQSLRGIALTTAVTLVAEIGDIQRFATPRALMAYIGLVPSEYSSGATIRQGSITKAGNSCARRMLIEAAWSYARPARITPERKAELNQQSAILQDISWKAQIRLCGRYRNLIANGKKPQVAITAIARELLGFVWAVSMQSQLRT